MKKNKSVDENTILYYSKKYNIPPSDSYELGISYVSFLNSIDTILLKEQRQNHYQPLQTLYYDRNGQLLSFQINCYAGGFPNLNWNRNQSFSVFPPKQQAPIDSIIALDNLLKHLNLLPQTEKFEAANFDYIVAVYWSRFMGRQSKRLIHYVQNNRKLAADKKVKIIYVNNDNIFLDTN